MLTLKNIYKEYTSADYKQTALKGINLSFSSNEFVSILGPSGSGKTTLLNIIGGLDRYDHGDLLINNKSTELFKDKDWDAYRNHTIGFIFQSYNLIMHISVYQNVEIGMTISGLSPEERQRRAYEVLERVGLQDHIHKRPNQLSGGQMQRVAIARALANDPDIILADEPTGALDSKTSVQIMALIQEIAKDKLVIMVTHNREIATQYSTRIVELLDGHILSDSNEPQKDVSHDGVYRDIKTSMSFKQALFLSFNNLKTKKIRTLITAFAGSIGIIGVALVLALSHGLNTEIDVLESTTLSEYPVVITQTPRTVNIAQQNPFSPGTTGDEGYEKFPTVTELYPYDERQLTIEHTNVLSEEYLRHVQQIPNRLVHEIMYNRTLAMNILLQTSTGVITSLNRSQARFSELFNNQQFFDETYDILEGTMPTRKEELLLVVDEYNRVDIRVLTALGFDITQEVFGFEDVIGKTFKLLLNDHYYRFDDNLGHFRTAASLENLYAHEQAITLEITGVARVKQDAEIGILSTGLKHLPALTEFVLQNARFSAIAQFQSEVVIHALNGLQVTEATRQTLLRTFGAIDTPTQILIYPKDFESKKAVKAYLDTYNYNKPREEQIIYTDLAETITNTIGTLVDTVTYVLVAFSAISLVVSSIMIGIITYISVLERTKEIGILRSLGARKRDISRVFNAETTIIGLTAGMMGVTLAYAMSFPINLLVSRMIEGVENIARLTILTALILIAVSVILTYVSGLIPASIASRKSPVEALKSD